jgi:hypothetical protein
VAGRVITVALGVAGLCTALAGAWALQVEGRTDPSHRQMLAERPLLGKAWLNLAVEEFQQTKVLTLKAVRFLELSLRGGPHEGDLMFERSLFGIAVWPQLTVALKERIAYDLSAALSYTPDERPLQLALLVSAMDTGERDELKALLVWHHVAEATLARIGF